MVALAERPHTEWLLQAAAAAGQEQQTLQQCLASAVLALAGQEHLPQRTSLEALAQQVSRAHQEEQPLLQATQVTQQVGEVPIAALATEQAAQVAQVYLAGVEVEQPPHQVRRTTLLVGLAGQVLPVVAAAADSTLVQHHPELTLVGLAEQAEDSITPPTQVALDRQAHKTHSVPVVAVLVFVATGLMLRGTRAALAALVAAAVAVETTAVMVAQAAQALSTSTTKGNIWQLLQSYQATK